MKPRTELVMCADLSAAPDFEPFVATVVGVVGDSVDVRRLSDGEVLPIDGEFVWYLCPFWEVEEADEAAALPDGG